MPLSLAIIQSVVFVERRHLVKLVKERIAEPSRWGRDGSLDGRGQVKLSDLSLHDFESGRLEISIRTLSTQNRNAFEQFCPKHFSRNGKKNPSPFDLFFVLPTKQIPPSGDPFIDSWVKSAPRH